MEKFMHGGSSAVVFAPTFEKNDRDTGAQASEDTEKQNRIAEAERFFNLLFGAVKERKFGYLWIKQGEERKTFPFDVSKLDERKKMAIKAIELSDVGADVYYGINLMDNPPATNARVTAAYVTVQTATVTDIDIEGGNHISDDKKKYPATFDEAKSFLPFPVSILINSGYGLHGLTVYDNPITITADNRQLAEERNKKFLEVIRSRAGIYSKAVDSVGDLPRVLRVPGTRNYKLGVSADAPLCHIVEVNDARFSPAQFDEKLNAFTVAVPSVTEPKPVQVPIIDYADDSLELKEFRIRRMLDYISVVDGEYEKWTSVGFALKNEGFDCSVWEQWSRTQPEFKEGECEAKWKTFHYDATGNTIGTLYQYAVEGGYDEKETQRDWYRLHPEFSKKKDSSTQIVDFKDELRSVSKALIDFNAEKDAALKKLRNVETFDSDTVFSEEIMTAAAFAKIFDKPTFSDFRREVKIYGDKHKDKKVSVNDWLADVKDRAAEIATRQANLIARRNEIQAQINSLSFVGKHDALKDFIIPQGYSISETSGIVKVDGEKSTPVCRRPVIITGKTFSVDDKIYKLALSFMTTGGKWKRLPPTEKAIIFNKNKLVDLANADLPVTSSNATHLVDFLDAFNALNENALPLNYNVSRCGWHNLEGKEYFVDPRRDCVIQDEETNISVKVDEVRSDFAKHLKQVGKLSEWKKIYKLAKKYPVARLIVAASVAPILLKILGERNFLLYIYAPTRAGKTTALYLGASAVGSEKIIRSFDATKNGLASAAADVSDYAFLVDEKQVADSRLKEAFDNLVYALANGIGRTKLNRDSTLKKLQDWRTIAIMTGETLLLPDNVTGGANTRLLTIKAPKEILPADICKIIRNTIHDNYGLALPLVADKIFEIGREKLRGVFEEMIDTFAARCPELLPEYRRYMAVLTIADTLLNSALFGNKVMTEDGNTIKVSDDAIQNSVKIFPLIPTTAEISDTGREKDFVRGIIAQNQNHFIGGNIEDSKIQGIWGKLYDADGYHYITVQALKDACQKYGYDYRKLITDLIADGFFTPADTIEKGRKTPLDTVKKRLGKASPRCYRISHITLDGD